MVLANFLGYSALDFMSLPPHLGRHWMKGFNTKTTPVVQQKLRMVSKDYMQMIITLQFGTSCFEILISTLLPMHWLTLLNISSLPVLIVNSMLEKGPIINDHYTCWDCFLGQPIPQCSTKQHPGQSRPVLILPHHFEITPGFLELFTLLLGHDAIKLKDPSPAQAQRIKSPLKNVTGDIQGMVYL